MARRRDLFPPDRGLQVRIVVALVAQVAVLGGLAWVVWWSLMSPGPWGFLALLGIVLAVGGIVESRRERGRRRRSVWLPQPFYERQVRQIAERLAVLGGLEVPEIVIESEPEPLSWTSQRPLRAPKLHVTTGLLQTLDAAEVEAVVAHELGHVAHRDTTVMTVLSAPSTGIERTIGDWWRLGRKAWILRVLAVVYGSYLVPVAAVLALGARSVARQRELAADRAAAVLTGSPAAVAAALLAASAALAERPVDELRTLAPDDPFHLLPAREPRGLRRLWATHPPLEVRIERLQRMEARLQGN